MGKLSQVPFSSQKHLVAYYYFKSSLTEHVEKQEQKQQQKPNGCISVL